jgi:hypothetical protein
MRSHMLLFESAKAPKEREITGARQGIRFAITHVLPGTALCAATTSLQAAEQRGGTDTEIRIGRTIGAPGNAEVAHFNWVNDRGGINGC